MFTVRLLPLGFAGGICGSTVPAMESHSIRAGQAIFANRFN
jgi:hypothetical protein